jgi:hypothetical protein
MKYSSLRNRIRNIKMNFVNKTEFIRVLVGRNTKFVKFASSEKESNK